MQSYPQNAPYPQNVNGYEWDRNRCQNWHSNWNPQPSGSTQNPKFLQIAATTSSNYGRNIVPTSQKISNNSNYVEQDTQNILLTCQKISNNSNQVEQNTQNIVPTSQNIFNNSTQVEQNTQNILGKFSNNYK